MSKNSFVVVVVVAVVAAPENATVFLILRPNSSLFLYWFNASVVGFKFVACQCFWKRLKNRMRKHRIKKRRN